jgi:hypothetical protein
MQHMFFILHFTQPALVTVHILKKDILLYPSCLLTVLIVIFGFQCIR